jgi:hypothetical protein
MRQQSLILLNKMEVMEEDRSESAVSRRDDKAAGPDFGFRHEAAP